MLKALRVDPFRPPCSLPDEHMPQSHLVRKLTAWSGPGRVVG
jgi:hypothetical protein